MRTTLLYKPLNCLLCTDQVVGYFVQSDKMQDKNLWLIIACAILKTLSVVEVVRTDNLKKM